ncbi:hypothetical protein Tco_1463754, partial [Tanacetum coccineum]
MTCGPHCHIEVVYEFRDDMWAPLPHGFGSEAVEEEQVGSGVFFGFGYPAVDSGAITQSWWISDQSLRK